MPRSDAPSGQGDPRDAHVVVAREIAAEAAVWVACLHGPGRSSQMERECRAWQARSAAHRVAFECCTDTWQDVALVTLRDYATAAAIPAPARSTRWRNRRFGWSTGVALAGAVVAGLLVAAPLWSANDTFATGVREQRTVILKDGTRMSLNTATSLRVELGPTERTVRVDEGEALFEVAKDAHRPFVVQVADREVVALGTVFSVRLTPAKAIRASALDVTLVEGQVSVRNTTGEGDKTAQTRPVLLKPGDRLRLSEQGGEVPKGARRETTHMDRPNVDQLMAWRRNETVFDDVPLSDAVVEMNRYSQQPIVLVGDGSAKGLRISGLFRTGDNVGFARAVAALHGLVAHELGDHLELAPR